MRLIYSGRCRWPRFRPFAEQSAREKTRVIRIAGLELRLANMCERESLPHVAAFASRARFESELCVCDVLKSETRWGAAP